MTRRAVAVLSAGCSRGGRRAGFTLIEMTVVVLFTAIVMAAAINFYLQISNQSSKAAALTQNGRRTTLALDRIARDLQSTVLVVKPDEVDPLAHPWFFLAEAGRVGEGADRIKFQARSHRPLSNGLHESDLAVVALWTAPDDEGRALELLRWSRARLPESLDQTFPRRDDEGVQVLASDVAAFGIALLDDEGNWSDSWDSSTLLRSSQLPVQVELRLALWDQDVEDPAFEEPPEPSVRRVLLPIRPLDLQPPEEGEAEDDEEDEDQEGCVTVAECRELNADLFDGLATGDPAFQGLLEALADECFDEQSTTLGLDVDEVDGCL